MSERVVALGGPPGSGKSTAGRTVAGALGLEFLSAGALFREAAGRRGLSLAELGSLAERDPSIDRALDDRMLSLARPGRLLDGRLVGALLRRRGVPVDYLWITASEAVRAERLARRDGVGLDRARSDLRARERSERARYLAHYGIDLDLERPDLAVDSTRAGPEEVAGELLRHLQRARTGP